MQPKSRNAIRRECPRPRLTYPLLRRTRLSHTTPSTHPDQPAIVRIQPYTPSYFVTLSPCNGAEGSGPGLPPSFVPRYIDSPTHQCPLPSPIAPVRSPYPRRGNRRVAPTIPANNPDRVALTCTNERGVQRGKAHLCRGHGGVPHHHPLRAPFLAGRRQGDGRNARP
jgi:hypothetical protein